jgi:energy-coupling factor transporter ATP-binding protein EcfA2
LTEKLHITNVRFKNYKAFEDFSISLKEFNVLVGPNNCGKSTVLGAFRLLSEGIRKAKSRNPEYLKDSLGRRRFGYNVSLKKVPIATENIFTNYDDTNPATITFKTRIADCSARGANIKDFSENIEDLLIKLSNPTKTEVLSQCLSRRLPYEKRYNARIDETTLQTRILTEFDNDWEKWVTRVKYVSGKFILSSLNSYLEEHYGVSLTPATIVKAMPRDSVHVDIYNILRHINELRLAELAEE